MSIDNYINTLTSNSKNYEYIDLKSIDTSINLNALPFAHKILLENLVRNQKSIEFTHDDFIKVAHGEGQDIQVAFIPTRVVLQDFTGVPAVVDLAAMRDALSKLGGDPQKINPLVPVDLVIDHSVMVDYFGEDDALEKKHKNRI